MVKNGRFIFGTSGSESVGCCCCWVLMVASFVTVAHDSVFWFSGELMLYRVVGGIVKMELLK